MLRSLWTGLPWWRSGWESACQCRGHGFEPWSGKIPHATEQLGPWATITEPARLELVLHNKRGRDSERPAQRDEEWSPLATTRESSRTETKTQHSNQSINQSINRNVNFKKKNRSLWTMSLSRAFQQTRNSVVHASNLITFDVGSCNNELVPEPWLYIYFAKISTHLIVCWYF